MSDENKPSSPQPQPAQPTAPPPPAPTKLPPSDNFKGEPPTIPRPFDRPPVERKAK
jgi:hypothetical protein